MASYAVHHMLHMLHMLRTHLTCPLIINGQVRSKVEML